MDPSASSPSLRERKRERTRAAIVAAGTRLFEERGYDATTIADIAEAADIGPRTFFGYFSGKEEILFPRSDARITTALRAIDTRRPGEEPTDVLLRGLREAGSQDDDLIDALAELRLRLLASVPAVQGRALRLQLEAQRVIAERLTEAYPDKLDPVSARALVGAFIGGVAGALQAMLVDAADRPDPEALTVRLAAAAAAALGRSPTAIQEPTASRPIR